MFDHARRSFFFIFLISRLISTILSTSCNVSSHTISNSWNHNKAAESSEIGFRFYPYSFRSPKGYNPRQCALYCEQDFRCKSFNYLSVEKICELNDEERKTVDVPVYVQVGQAWIETVNGFIPHEGSQYFSREVFKLKSKDFLSECSSNPCPPDHVCSSGDSGAHQCQKTIFTKEDFYKNWNDWGEWSDCSLSCGVGVQERTRECESTDFWWCIGRSSDRRLCNETPCPIWSSWHPWSDCDSTNGCGFGNRNRTRDCLYASSSDLCPGNDTEERICHNPSCDTPAMLSSGKRGDAFIFDDTWLYEPVWRRVCEPKGEKTTLTVKLTICNALGLDLADDDETPGNPPNDDDLVFQPIICPLDAKRLMDCTHNGWINAKDCQKFLAVKCTDSPAKFETIQCSNGGTTTISCSGEKEIRVDDGFHGREKGTTTCSASAVQEGCFAVGALELFEKTCSHHASCSVPASSSQFGGNPCPSSTSYSKIKYSCIRYLLPFYAGMNYADSRILDSKISASSVRTQHYASHARLDRNIVSYDAWMPDFHQVAVGQWIMVDFDKPVYVLGAITQSRLATTHGDDWITKYIVAYGNDTNSLVTIKDDKGNAEIFPGNTGFQSYSISYFSRPVFAQYARLIIKGFADDIGLRMEWLVAEVE